MSHRVQQFLLRVEIEIFKNVRRQRVRQNSKDDYLFVFRHIENHFGDVGRWPLAKHFAQCPEIAGID